MNNNHHRIDDNKLFTPPNNPKEEKEERKKRKKKEKEKRQLARYITDAHVEELLAQEEMCDRYTSTHLSPPRNSVTRSRPVNNCACRPRFASPPPRRRLSSPQRDDKVDR